nr:hypothetical protein [Tanacetum cinerariifolium]
NIDASKEFVVEQRHVINGTKEAVCKLGTLSCLRMRLKRAWWLK